jgi:hypothetical protein
MTLNLSESDLVRHSFYVEPISTELIPPAGRNASKIKEAQAAGVDTAWCRVTVVVVIDLAEGCAIHATAPIIHPEGDREDGTIRPFSILPDEDAETDPLDEFVKNNADGVANANTQALAELQEKVEQVYATLTGICGG